MRIVCFILLISLLIATAVFGQSVTISGPAQVELTEGKTYTCDWSSPDVVTVVVRIYGPRTPLGSASRGEFEFTPALTATGQPDQAQFIVPWVDAIQFTMKLKAYDFQGRLLAVKDQAYRFRPAILENRLKDGIYLDLHRRINQRLYVEKDGAITHCYLSSSSQNYLWLPRNRHIAKPHDHAGVFKVLDKSPSHWSKEFNVEMPWALHYLAGHYIHATSRRFYRYLGTPASHGCNRLTRQDAKELYKATPVGTRVEVIGPSKR
jgi:hypothetical protein